MKIQNAILGVEQLDLINSYYNRNISLILILWSILAQISCNSKQILTYSEGILNCNNIIQEVKSGNRSNLEYYGNCNCLIGYLIPDFQYYTLEGKLIDSSYFNSRITIINFWFSTCQPCIEEIPIFNKIQEKYQDKVNFFAISADKINDIVEFTKLHNWNFIQLANGKFLINEVFKLSWGYPTTLVINKNSEIIATFNGGPSNDKSTEQLYNKLSQIIESEL